MRDKPIIASVEQVEDVPSREFKTSISRDDLRSLFYVFSKKANTISQNFYGKSIIKKDDIIELSSKIFEKLKLNQVDMCTCCIVVALKNNKFLEFGGLEKFTEHTFDEGDVVENIVLKFNFLMNIDRSVPQHYSMNIRLAGSMSPMFLLRHIFNQVQNDFDDIENMLPSSIVNIDYVEAIMSDELILIVENWYKSRRQVVIEGKIIEWIKKNNNLFPNISSIFCTLVGITISSILLFRHDFSFLNYMGEYRRASILILSFFGMVWISKYIGKRVGYSIKKNIQKMGEIPIFQLTKGDLSNLDKIAQNNSNSKIKLILHFCIQFILGFFASYVVWLLTNS